MSWEPVRRTVLGRALGVGVAVGTYGISFGALATTSGLTVLQTCTLSVLTFTGGSQFALVGVLGAVGWLWMQIRNQQRLDDFGNDGAVTGVSRVDLLLGSVGGLWLPGLGIAGGLALRMLADFTQTRVGGSITGFVEGDVLAVELFADEAADAGGDDR